MGWVVEGLVSSKGGMRESARAPAEPSSWPHVAPALRKPKLLCAAAGEKQAAHSAHMVDVHTSAMRLTCARSKRGTRNGGHHVS